MHYKKMALTIALLSLPHLNLMAQSKPDAWYLENSMMTINETSRYLGGLIVSNPTSNAVYVKTSVEAVELVDGKRVRVPVNDEVLRVYPDEFVLRPGDSFTGRLVADVSKLKANSQSFYVKFTDISNTKTDSQISGGIQNAYLLAFEAIVAVTKQRGSQLTPDLFSLKSSGANFELKNLTGRHIYLYQGGGCPADRPLLVNCAPIDKFPRQSMLPNETLTLPAVNTPFLGLMAFPGLNQRDKAEIVYLPTAGITH